MKTQRLSNLWFWVLAPIVVVAFTTVSTAQTSYEIIDLTENADVLQSVAESVNEAGEVVGWSALPQFLAQAVYWDADHQGHLLPRLPLDNSNTAVHITEAGLVLGVSDRVTIKDNGGPIMIFQDEKAVTWLNGGVENLNTLVKGGDELDLFYTRSANGLGQFVGQGRRPDETMWRGFFFENGIVAELGELDTGQSANQPMAINAAGQVAGFAAIGADKAFLWQDGVLTNLHNHPLIGGVTSRAFDLNEAGLIVGHAQFDISQGEAPTRWDDGEPTNLLADLFGNPAGDANAINTEGQIVGWVNDLDDLNDESRAFLLDGENYHDLIDLVPEGLGWDQLVVASDINDQGWIVGGGRRFGALGHAFLLIPGAGSPADLDSDGDVDAADLAILLGGWGPCEDCDECPTDLNGDCEVSAFDLAILLGSWG